jgi:alcohol dehydrogenase class IV
LPRFDALRGLPEGRGFSPAEIAAPHPLADPELTLGMPPGITAGTGLDALAHNVEAYLAKGYHPMCDAIFRIG